MVTFTCPTCGQERTGERRRCYPCTVRQSLESRERIRQSLLGKKHDAQRRQANAEAQRRRTAARFDLAGFMHGRPSGNTVPVGHRRVGNGHWQIKCPDGRFRYEHRVIWELAHGPIPHGVVIHHINHDPFDNRLDNLQALTKPEHAKHHIQEHGRDWAAKGRATRQSRKAAGGKY